MQSPTSPKQDNGSDDGVFVRTWARFLVLGLPPNYNQDDIIRMRKRIVAETISNKCLEYDRSPFIL